MTIEDLQERVAAIQKTIEAIKTSGVSERALFLLVQHSAPSVKGKKIPVSVIKAVFDGMDGLEAFITAQDDEWGA